MNARPHQRQARSRRGRLHRRSERIGWRAWKKVYPKSARHTAENCFSRLMKKDEFSARIAGLAEAAAQGAVMVAREVLEELSRIGRANMADL